MGVEIRGWLGDPPPPSMNLVRTPISAPQPEHSYHSSRHRAHGFERSRCPSDLKSSRLASLNIEALAWGMSLHMVFGDLVQHTFGIKRVHYLNVARIMSLSTLFCQARFVL